MREHSRVGLITNSSTAVYTTADVDAPKAYEEFINKILELAGSDKTASDIVRISRERQFDEDLAHDMFVDEFEDWDPNDILRKSVTAAEAKVIIAGGRDSWATVRTVVDRLYNDPHTRDALLQRCTNEDSDPYHVRVISKKNGEDIECIMVHIDGEEYAC